MVDTRFGLHIIRLDGIQEQHYLPYEQVKARIMADLEGVPHPGQKEYFAKFRLTDNARMDGAALEELFAPCKANPNPNLSRVVTGACAHARPGRLTHRPKALHRG